MTKLTMFQPDEFLEVLQGVRDADDLSQGNTLIGPGGQVTVLEKLRYNHQNMCFSNI